MVERLDGEVYAEPGLLDNLGEEDHGHGLTMPTAAAPVDFQ
jgi:hypothetical protein